MTEPLKESQKIQSLEGLRGVMAGWVILGHLSQTFEWHFPLLNRDVLAVDVFILLSGFVIARLIDVRHEPYGRYITRRALRIFPLYLLVLAISVLMVGVQLKAVTPLSFGDNVNSTRALFAREALARMPEHLAAHIPLAQGVIPDAWLPGTDFTLVGQAWSISLEWQFYLLAPLLMGSLTKRRWPLVVMAAGVLILLKPYFDMAFLGAKIIQFLLGICTYLAVSRTQQRKVWLPVVAALVIAAFAKDGPTQILPLTIWAVLLVSTYAASAGLLRLPARVLGAPPAIHFGEMGYSLYLVHMIPLYLSLYGLERIGVKGVAMQLGVTAATLAGAYVLARLSFHWVEKPGIALGARLTRGPA